MPKLIFPKERQDDYKGRITFHPVEYDPPQVNTQAFSGSAFDRGFGRGILSKNLTTVDANKIVDETIGAPPSVLAAQPNFPVKNNTTYAKGATEVVNRTKGVQLYLPSALQFNDMLSYEQFNLGAIGAIGAAGMMAGQGAVESIRKGVSQAGSSMVGLITGNITDQRAARLAAVRAAEYAPAGETVSNAVGTALGVASNPNTRALFRNVQLREFTFSFTLIAGSATEADEIEKIVKFFRTEAYPDAIRVPGGLDVAVGYEFPNKFLITMEHGDTRVGFKILPVFLRGIQTTFNPNNMGYHRDGKPSEVTLTLTFGESRTLTKQDIEDDY